MMVSPLVAASVRDRSSVVKAINDTHLVVCQDNDSGDPVDSVHFDVPCAGCFCSLLKQAVVSVRSRR